MAYTQRQIVATRAFRIYSGGDPADSSGLELQDFELAVDSARAYKIVADYRASLRLTGERIVNQAWLQNYPSTIVEFNSTNNLYFAKLPSQVLGDLPNGMGLYFISPTQNPNAPFFPLTIAQQWQFSSLPQDSDIYYYFDDVNVYFSRFDPSIKNVFMQIVPLKSDTIPTEFENDIIDILLNQFLKPKQIAMENKLANNNPNKPDTEIK